MCKSIGETLADLITKVPGAWKELSGEQKELIKKVCSGPSFNLDNSKIRELTSWFDTYS